MRINVDICGCFPTGKYYPGIADRIGSQAVSGLQHGISPAADWRDHPWVVVDFETTGLHADVDRIIEIGLVHFEKGVVKDTWHQLVHPEMVVPDSATAIHGITNEALKDQPTFATVWPKMESFLKGKLLIAYNASFDAKFLKAEVARAAPLAADPLENVVWVDPLVWVRELYKGDGSFKLTAVAERLGIPLENAHRATHDAEATGHVLHKMADFELIPKTYSELIRIQQRYAMVQSAETSHFRKK